MQDYVWGILASLAPTGNIELQNSLSVVGLCGWQEKTQPLKIGQKMNI